MRLINSVIILSILINLTGCAELLFRRTFVDEMEKEDESWFEPGRDFPMVAGDRGAAYRSRQEIMARTPKFPKEQMRDKYDNSIQAELQEKIEKLDSNERAEFYSVEGQLQSESEQLYYLSLPRAERRAYLSSRTPASVESEHHKELAFMQNRRDDRGELYLGMSKGAVRKTWGNPYRIEYAGDPNHQNEKWTFYRNGKIREVYFESGRVDGWSLN